MRRSRALLLALLLQGCAGTPPGSTWPRLDDPARHGWKVARLEAACELAAAAGSDAVMVVQHGKLVWTCGDVSQPYPMRSMRKPLLSPLIGQLIDEEQLSLGTTLAELGIDDEGGLSETEKSATIEDLLTSRSGVYLPAAYEHESNRNSRPARGSHAPGTFFHYNNWDFNVLGVIVEQVSGRRIAELFAERIATPLGMEDFRIEHVSYRHEAPSRHPAFLFEASARDLARLGQLYLQGGTWQGQSIVSSEWTTAATAAHAVNAPTEQDFGYLWWSQGAIASRGIRQRSFVGRGAGQQRLWVFPEDQLVIVHLANTGSMLGFYSFMGWLPSGEEFMAVLHAILDARPVQAASGFR